MENTYRDINKSVQKYDPVKLSIIGGAVIVTFFFVMMFIGEFFQVIQPSYKGLVIKGGQLQEEVLGDGFYPKKPFWTDIVPVYTGVNTTDSAGS